jgi:hypothetical protein
MSILSRIREQFVEAKTPLAKTRIVSTPYIEEKPDVEFSKLMYYHDRTPQLQIAVSSYSELITGTELQINSENEKAKKLLDEWNIKTNFYDKFESLVATLLICGNAIFEKLDENKIEDIAEVDMATISGKKRNEVGELLYYKQQQGAGGLKTLGENSLQKFIEFNLTQYSRIPWGRSLFYSLAIPRNAGGRTMMPMIESLWAMEDSMIAIMNNNAYPITMIHYEGISDDDLEKEAEKWRKLKPGDKMIISRKPEIITHETDPQSKYTDYIKHIEKTFEIGTQFPHDIMTGDFTSRASSDTTHTILMQRVKGLQRYLANKLKLDLYNPILEQNGINPSDANITVSFSTQNIVELTPDQVLNRVSNGLWTKNEGRMWDKNNLGVNLVDDDMIQQKDDINQQSDEPSASDLRAVQKRAKEIKKEFKKK